MFLKLSRVVIGSDLYAMAHAIDTHAYFIPVNYHAPFGWEYLEFYTKHISQFRDLRCDKNRNDILMYTFYGENNEIFEVPCWLWELEQFFKFWLLTTGRLYNDFKINKCFLNEIDGKKILKFQSKNDSTLVIECDEACIINAGDHFFTNYISEPTKIEESEYCHILYHVKLNKEDYQKDMRGLTFTSDMETLPEGCFFSKRWNSTPFGRKKNRSFKATWIKRNLNLTTYNITFICENVPYDEAHSFKYDKGNVRLEIYKYLDSLKEKRIQERINKYEKYINKIIISKSYSYYDNIDNIKFLYIDSEDFFTKRRIRWYTKWVGSSQRIHYHRLKTIIHSWLTDQ